MENNRPRGREKHVTGSGKTVQKRGAGLGTGPVGSPSGHSGRGQPSGGGTRSSGNRGGGMKLIILLLALLLGGGGGLTALLGNQPGVSQPPSTGQQQQQPQGSGSTDWAQLLSGLGGGSVSAGWQGEANTGRLDESVAPGAREKYTRLLGGGYHHGLHVRYGPGVPQRYGYFRPTGDAERQIWACRQSTGIHRGLQGMEE